MKRKLTSHRRQLLRVLGLCVALGTGLAPAAEAAQRYVSATVDQAGELRIVAADGRIETIRKEAEQVGFEQIEISPAGDAVGWVGMQMNCCTSYDIPSHLAVRAAGQTRRHRGNGLPVWTWAFSASGKEVAFHQETVHGSLRVHYELRDVASGRLVAEFTPEVDIDNRQIPDQVVPEWVKALWSKR